MLKSQEIEILRATVAQLGADSYCGPWLSQSLPSIEADIRSDYSPLVNWNQTRDDCEQMRAEAKAAVDEILARANKEAEKIVAEARNYAANVKQYAGEALRRALRDIGS